MEITLSDGQIIDVISSNYANGSFDWKRREGYTGVCVSYTTFTSFATVEKEIKAALEIEIAGGEVINE